MTIELKYGKIISDPNKIIENCIINCKSTVARPIFFETTDIFPRMPGVVKASDLEFEVKIYSIFGAKAKILKLSDLVENLDKDDNLLILQFKGDVLWRLRTNPNKTHRFWDLGELIFINLTKMCSSNPEVVVWWNCKPSDLSNGNHFQELGELSVEYSMLECPREIYKNDRFMSWNFKEITIQYVSEYSGSHYMKYDAPDGIRSIPHSSKGKRKLGLKPVHSWLSKANPYSDLGLERPFLIAYGKHLYEGNDNKADQIIKLWKTEWAKQFNSKHPIINLIFEGEINESDGKFLSSLLSDYTDLYNKYMVLPTKRYLDTIKTMLESSSYHDNCHIFFQNILDSNSEVEQEILSMWTSKWWRQYPLSHILVNSVFSGKITNETATFLHQIYNDHGLVVETFLKHHSTKVMLLKSILAAGFRGHQQAILGILKGGDPKKVAQISNIDIDFTMLDSN